MKKIVVLGCGGSGKSTFSKKLGVLMDIPIYHLDTFYWKPGWEALSQVEFDKILNELVIKDHWITDGNFIRTIDIRIEAADTVIFFDMPRYLCMYRIVKRRFMYIGKSRPDITEGCKEKLDFEFVNWVWNFNKDVRPKIIEKLKEYSKEKDIIVFSSKIEVAKYLKGIKDLKNIV